MKRFLKIAAGLVAALVAVLLALPFLINVNRFRPLLEQRASQALGRTVTIGNLSLSLLEGGVAASNLAVAEDPAFGANPFLSADHVSIGVDLPALIFERALRVRNVTIGGAQAALIENKDGVWNFSTLGAARPAPAAAVAEPPAPAEEAMDLFVKLVRIENASVHLTSGSSRHEFTNVNFELRDFAEASAMPFALSASVGGGSASLQGTAGPLNEGDIAATPFNTRIEIKALDLAAAGFADPSSGMGGVLTFNGDANSDGRMLTVKGAATIDGLKLSKTGAAATRPVAANLALVQDLRTRRGNVARSTIKLGSASANLTATYSVATTPPTLEAAIDGAGMPLPELMAFLPMFDVVLPAGATTEGGTLSLKVASRGTTTNLTSTGSIRIENARLTNYNLAAKLKVIQQLAGIQAPDSTAIDLVGAAFTLSSAGSVIRDIQFIAPAIGQLSGEGTVSPAKALDFRMKAVVKTGGLLAAATQQRGETTTVPFFIQGTASDPVFRADVKSIANEKIQQAIANPEGAVKNVTETAKGILKLFKKAPAKQPEQK